MPAPDPAEAMRHCDEGFALLESGRFADAEARLLQARALAPDHPKVHFRMALLYVDTGRPDAALAALDRSLELDPDDARGFAGAIIATIVQENLAAELRQKSKQQAATFSWEKTATETLLLYDQVLAGVKAK